MILAIGLASVGRAQEPVDKTGTMLINFHVGPSFANFISAEAPHKYISDLWHEDNFIAVAIPLVNYETQFIQDHKIGLAVGISLEKYITNDVSIWLGLNYEAKGIDLNYKGSKYLKEDGNPIFEKGHFGIEANNNYLSVPIVIRKYFVPKQIFYAQAGIHLAYLTASEISVDAARAALIESQVTGSTGVNLGAIGSDIPSLTIKDKSKDNTHLFDYGISAGCGLKLPLGSGIYFTTDLLINMGLRKIDRKNNNEYKKVDLASTTGYNHAIISGKYYGLSSKAKNLNSALTVGVSIEL